MFWKIKQNINRFESSSFEVSIQNTKKIELEFNKDNPELLRV